MPVNENSESFIRRAEIAKAAWIVRFSYEDVAEAIGGRSMATARCLISQMRRLGMIHGYTPRVNKGDIYANATRSESGCLLWNRAKARGGYGNLRYGGRMRLAHSVSWEIANGTSVPSGMVVCHSCDTPACIEPSHLFVGTYQDNMNDMKAKGRSEKQKGMDKPTAKLTDDMVREIRTLAACGESHLSLAVRFSVGKTTIYSIVNRRTWKHVQ